MEPPINAVSEPLVECAETRPGLAARRGITAVRFTAGRLAAVLAIARRLSITRGELASPPSSAAAAAAGARLN